MELMSKEVDNIKNDDDFSDLPTRRFESERIVINTMRKCGQASQNLVKDAKCHEHCTTTKCLAPSPRQ